MCKFADRYPNFRSAKISPHRSTLLVKADGPALSTGGPLTAGGLVHTTQGQFAPPALIAQEAPFLRWGLRVSRAVAASQRLAFAYGNVEELPEPTAARLL